MTRVAIIGGGIAGLSVAMLRARAGDQVTLVEAEAVLGGQLRTERTAGFVVEHGAEGFVASSRAVQELADELGIGASVVGQLTTRSFGFDGRALVPLAPGEAAQFLGFQVPKRELGAGIRAFSGGMGEVVEALANALGVAADVRVGECATRLIRAGSAWQLQLRRETVVADHVVIATGARAAAALLEPELGSPARELARAEALSSVTVSLAYRRTAIAHALDGTGFVVGDPGRAEGLRACTFTSSKLPNRAPASHALLRAFFRPNAEDIAQLSDAEWCVRAERGLGYALAPSEPAERSWVARWRDALPVSDAAHAARVAALENALAGSNVALAGAAFHGSGIDAAVRSARRAAAFGI